MHKEILVFKQTTMASWSHIEMNIEGRLVKAQAPMIISASRSTDIPAFYADWFFDRLNKGYSAWTNPFNGVKSYVSYSETRFIVFWSKNPRPLLEYLHILEERNIKCYIQYTLNDYEKEKLEKVPTLSNRIETFKMLVDRLGKGAVVWRFDPLILTDNISIDDLLRKIQNIGDQLKGYTEKQWGKKCNELPSFIIKRLPLRFEYNNNYFNDIYQGIPIGGYTKLINELLKNIPIKLNEDFLKNKDYYKKIAKKIIYSGAIDEYFDYKIGKLEYRSLKFDLEKINKEFYQKNCVINFTDVTPAYTRIIEHKYFENDKSPVSWITKEYPVNYVEGMEKYYPLNDEKNNRLYEKYLELAKNESNVIFSGRLGRYKYYDMDDVIELAFNDLAKENIDVE